MSDLYCNGKRAYDKRGAVTALNLRYREDHQRLRMYPCERGDHWHLTKQLRGTHLMPGNKYFVKKFKR